MRVECRETGESPRRVASCESVRDSGCPWWEGGSSKLEGWVRNREPGAGSWELGAGSRAARAECHVADSWCRCRWPGAGCGARGAGCWAREEMSLRVLALHGIQHGKLPLSCARLAAAWRGGVVDRRISMAGQHPPAVGRPGGGGGRWPMTDRRLPGVRAFGRSNGERSGVQFVESSRGAKAGQPRSPLLARWGGRGL
jgi:hypothetical protein